MNRCLSERAMLRAYLKEGTGAERPTCGCAPIARRATTPSSMTCRRSMRSSPTRSHRRCGPARLACAWGGCLRP